MKIIWRLMKSGWHLMRSKRRLLLSILGLVTIFFIMTYSLYLIESNKSNLASPLFEFLKPFQVILTSLVIALIIGGLTYWLFTMKIPESLYKEGILKENHFTKHPLKIFCILFYIIFFVCCMIRIAFRFGKDPFSSELHNYLILSGIISLGLALLCVAIPVVASLKRTEDVRQIKIFFLGIISAAVIYFFGYLEPFLARSQGASPFVQLYVIPIGLIILLGVLTVLYVDQREQVIKQETGNSRFKYPLWDAFIIALAMPGILVAALNNVNPSAQDQNGVSNKTEARLERMEQQIDQIQELFQQEIQERKQE